MDNYKSVKENTSFNNKRIVEKIGKQYAGFFCIYVSTNYQNPHPYNNIFFFVILRWGFK